jgi:hypothetical protein
LQRSQNQHVEGPLQELETRVVGVFHHGRRESTALDVDCLRLVRTARGCDD